MESQKATKEEKKDEWAKILENHRNMILNFTSMDGRSAAMSPTADLKKVLDCASLVEAQVAVIYMMKREGVRWSPPYHIS